MKPPRVDFAAEAAEHLENARSILEKSATPRPAEINELFRAAHSLKSLAGLTGCDHFGRALHQAEEMLDKLRLSKLSWSTSVAEALTGFLDLLEDGIEDYSRTGSDVKFSVENATVLLAPAAAPPAAATERPLADDLDLPPHTIQCLSEYEESRLRSNLLAGAQIFIVEATFPLETFEGGLKDLGTRLNETGEWIATLPQVSGFSADSISVQLLAAAPTLPREGFAAGRVRSVRRVAAAEPVPSPPRLMPGKSVRLAAVKLEELLFETEEVRAAFEKLEARMRPLETAISPSHRAELLRHRARLAAALDRLGRSAADLRTTPLSQLAARLTRAAERLVKTSGKKIAFRVVGGEVEIDRALAEDLADPLLHILRNAVDHGIEPPAERRTAGKPEEGLVTLMARSRRSRLLLSIADDGRGIDEARVQRRARELHWLQPEEAISREKTWEFLFRPGFSTAAGISEVSGRGVGLDVVAERVAARGGEVHVLSEPGRGCRFEIEVAIARAVFKALIVEEGGWRYAVPLAAVRRVEVETPTSASVAIGEALGQWQGPVAGPRVCLQLHDGSAFSASRVVSEETIVARPVDAPLPPYIVGAAEGEQLEAIFVLDPKRLMRSFQTGLVGTSA